MSADGRCVVAILPEPRPRYVEAVEQAGGRVAGLDEGATAVLWLSYSRAGELGGVLDAHPGIDWVQLPWAGVDAFADALRTSDRDGLTWTSAKGAYSEPVAEHALALTLALLRFLPERARATSWGDKRAVTLHRAKVVLVGAGGIALEILRLLAPFDAEVTVVRRSPEAVEGAARTVGTAELGDVVGDADVLILAAAATGETARLVDADLLARLRPSAVLVNIARGTLVDTEALADALAEGRLAGAGLDVTDPEPLPDGHRLWTEPRCLITPHSADTPEMTAPLLAERLRANVERYRDGRPMLGVVDPSSGY